MGTRASDGGSTTHPIAPTLVVGLGGLGREVVFRTRRRLYERYRRTDLPFLRFVWLDRDTDTDPTPELPARLARKVSLPPEQRLSLPIEDATIASLLANPASLPPWCSKTALENRARTVRSRLLGRLALHLRASDVAALLKTQLAAASHRDARQAALTLGFPVTDDATPEVFIVTSLAGGLGSGSLADLALLARGAFPGVRVRGVLFLSGMFMAYDMARRELAMANGYAAAKELVAAQGDAKRRPFDALYLVDRENAAGRRPIDPLEPLEMVAENLVLELSRSELASALRGIRRDQSTATSFAAFGMASISPGGGRLRSAAAYLLGARLLDYWKEPSRRPDARNCGLAAGWPEDKLAAAATDLAEEYETYDIPPVEERNLAFPTPEDLGPPLFAHLRDALALAEDDGEDEILAQASKRFENACTHGFVATRDGAGDPWEATMDRLELFCLEMCRKFDRRMAANADLEQHLEDDANVAEIRAWSEPWAPMGEGDEPFATLVGSGIRSARERIARLGEPILDFHPGTVLRFCEASPRSAARFSTLRSCHDAYETYRQTTGETVFLHRHTTPGFAELPDLL